MGDRLLTRKETAERLNVSLVTLWRLVKDGDLHACKIGRNVRITESELQRYLDGITRVGRPESV